MPYKDPRRQKEYLKKWRQENKENLREYDVKYYAENRAKKLERRRERYHTDPYYKLRHNVKVLIYTALKGGKGGESFLPYVDWTTPELKEHL